MSLARTGFMLSRIAMAAAARGGALEEHVLGLSTRFDGMSEDMRQRFRVLTERVGGIESRLAA